MRRGPWSFSATWVMVISKYYLVATEVACYLKGYLKVLKDFSPLRTIFRNLKQVGLPPNSTLGLDEGQNPCPCTTSHGHVVLRQT